MGYPLGTGAVGQAGERPPPGPPQDGTRAKADRSHPAEPCPSDLRPAPSVSAAAGRTGGTPWVTAVNTPGPGTVLVQAAGQRPHPQATRPSHRFQLAPCLPREGWEAPANGPLSLPLPRPSHLWSACEKTGHHTAGRGGPVPGWERAGAWTSSLEQKENLADCRRCPWGDSLTLGEGQVAVGIDGAWMGPGSFQHNFRGHVGLWGPQMPPQPFASGLGVYLC